METINNYGIINFLVLSSNDTVKIAHSAKTANTIRTWSELKSEHGTIHKNKTRLRLKTKTGDILV
jgi:hypothetical protein